MQTDNLTCKTDSCGNELVICTATGNCLKNLRKNEVMSGDLQGSRGTLVEANSTQKRLGKNIFAFSGGIINYFSMKKSNNSQGKNYSN